jgi:antirestriction protein ArdC
MPGLTEFECPEAYYHTYFHELSHWTGHHSRLNRDLTGRFGSNDYSREELIAEMSACFLCAETGIIIDDLLKNSAAYLQNWINALKGEPRLLMTAASAAERAAQFLTESFTMLDIGEQDSYAKTATPA